MTLLSQARTKFFALKLRHLALALVLCLSILLSSITTSVGSEGYPGSIKGHDASIVVSAVIVQMGVQAFHKAHNHWPATWEQVIQDGLWQTGIPTQSGEAIDPDDPSVDFLDDVYYAADQVSGSSGNVSILMGGQPTGSPQVKTVEIEAPKDYDLLFQEMDSYLDSQLESRYSDDLQMKRLFAILGEVSSMSGIFFTTHGRWPENLDEFLESGLSPINRSSINPVTGVTFRFDGSGGDVTIEFLELGPRLRHFDRDGSVPANPFTY